MIESTVAVGAPRPTRFHTLGDLTRVVAVAVVLNGALLAVLLQRLG